MESRWSEYSEKHNFRTMRVIIVNRCQERTRWNPADFFLPVVVRQDFHGIEIEVEWMPAAKASGSAISLKRSTVASSFSFVLNNCIYLSRATYAQCVANLAIGYDLI